MNDDVEMNHGLVKKCEMAFAESWRKNQDGRIGTAAQSGTSYDTVLWLNVVAAWFAYYNVRTVEDAERVGRIAASLQEGMRKRF